MISKLSDSALVREVKTKVRMEKRIVTEVLSYLEEIDKRKHIKMPKNILRR